MPKYNSISFDIETLATNHDALVLSLGGALFNLDEEDTYNDIREDESRCFYAPLELQSQLDLGRKIDASNKNGTLQWWLSQSKEAQSVFNENKFTVEQALSDLTLFCTGVKYAWGNGNMFDNVIIRSLYATFGMKYPFHYRNDLDLRTYKIAAGNPKISVPTNGFVKHNALEDAVFQAILLQKFHAEIKRVK